MRTRALIAGGLLALVASAAFVGPARAQEEEPTPISAEESEEVIHEAEEIAEENGAEHADVECIPLLVDGGSVDDCQEAPNPILPPVNELIWGSISFIVLFVLLSKFAFPAIKSGMEARTERIKDDLEGAESAKVEAQGVLDEYRAQLGDAKTEATRIIEEARQQGDAVRREQEQRLQTELAAMRERASADVEAAKAQAIADLRGEVANLAIGAAEVVVGRNLDHATQAQLVEQYIASVGNRN
jgi:F-type H+-transporting ATPase subunit b